MKWMISVVNDSVRPSITLLMTMILAGCVTAHPLTLPNGAQGQVISCNGMARSISDCYVKAGEVCPLGYDIVDANGESHPMIVATGGDLVAGSVISRSLMVHCH